jgi:transcriptional regulator with XRE-family HTH domain
MAQRDAASACGWSGARLSYLETGQRPVTADDLAALLPLYEVPESDRAPYYDAVRVSEAEGWWERFDPLLDDLQPMYVGLEQGAAEIRTFEPLLVPGILQVEEYVAAIMRGGLRRRGEREIARLVELRTNRQGILTRTEQPAKLDVVLDQSVLYRSPPRPSGPGALGPQLDHLVDMATRPNVTLRILPFEGGVQAFAMGPFSILYFPKDQPEPMVYIEHRGGAMWFEEFDAIERYALAFDGLASLALDPEASLAMVREAKERHAPP